MSTSGNTKLIARCCADFAGDLAADPEGIKAAVTACLAGGGLAAGGLAAAPVVVPLVLFVGLNALLHGIERRDNKKTDADHRAFLDALFNTLQSDMGDVDALLTETYIGQQIESQDLRERLGFISEIVKHNADTTESIDARTDRIEQMLVNHPDHTARFEQVLKENYLALDGKLDENQQGIVFVAFGNEVLYLAVEEFKQLQIEANRKLDDLQDGQEVLNLQHEKTHDGIAKTQDDIAQLKQMIQAISPQADSSSPDPAEADRVLESGLTRLAQDADRGVESARKAIKDKSAQEAGDYFIEKLAALDHAREVIEQRIDEEEIQISREAAELLFRTGRIEDAERAVGRILKCKPNDLDATNRLGHIHHLRGDLPAAEQQYRRLLDLAPDKETCRAAALGNLGNIAQTRSDLDTAETFFHHALEIDHKLGNLEGQASSLGNLGGIARIRGDLATAEKLQRESLNIHRKLGRLEGQAIALGNLGTIAQTRGDINAAEKFHRESLDIHRKLGRLEGQAIALTNLGAIAGTRKDLDTAEKFFQEALDLHRKLGRLEGQATSLGNLGVITQARGDLDAAEKFYREALDLHRKLGRLEGQANQLGNLGLIAQTRDDLDEARSLWLQSRHMYAQVGILHRVEVVQGWLDGLPPS